MSATRERRRDLWLLTLSPAIWMAHFLASYITVALWCAKVAPRSGPLGSARAAVLAYTIVAFFAVCAAAWFAYRRHKPSDTVVPHDFDTRDARARFLGFAALLLSLMSAVAVAYVGISIAFVETCR